MKIETRLQKQLRERDNVNICPSLRHTQLNSSTVPLSWDGYRSAKLYDRYVFKINLAGSDSGFESAFS